MEPVRKVGMEGWLGNAGAGGGRGKGGDGMGWKGGGVGGGGAARGGGGGGKGDRVGAAARLGGEVGWWAVWTCQEVAGGKGYTGWGLCFFQEEAACCSLPCIPAALSPQCCTMHLGASDLGSPDTTTRP